jgi:hypothetical protein
MNILFSNNAKMLVECGHFVVPPSRVGTEGGFTLRTYGTQTKVYLIFFYQHFVPNGTDIERTNFEIKY